MICVTAPMLSHCRVDAGGVPAEWLEANVATASQRTIVCFLGGGYGVDALEQNRPSAGDLAVATGARVLTIACLAPDTPSLAAAVKNGVTAYAWLLGEGCDVNLTAFTHDSVGASLLEGILVAARSRGLPVPAGEGGRP